MRGRGRKPGGGIPLVFCGVVFALLFGVSVFVFPNLYAPFLLCLTFRFLCLSFLLELCGEDGEETTLEGGLEGGGNGVLGLTRVPDLSCHEERGRGGTGPKVIREYRWTGWPWNVRRFDRARVSWLERGPSCSRVQGIRVRAAKSHQKSKLED